MSTDTSIHPRAYHKEPRKANTNKSKDKNVTKRKIVAMSAHLERHPRDSLTQNHISKLEATL